MSDLTTEELELGIAIAKRAETPLEFRSPALCDEMSWEEWSNRYGIKAIRELHSRREPGGADWVSPETVREMRLRIAELEEAAYLADTERALSESCSAINETRLQNIAFQLGPLLTTYTNETLEAVGDSLAVANRAAEVARLTLAMAREGCQDSESDDGE